MIEDILPFVLNVKLPIGEILLLSYLQLWVFLEKIEIQNFFENTQNCFAFISVTKCRSEAVLYSKRMAECPLSPHIKTIAVAF